MSAVRLPLQATGTMLLAGTPLLDEFFSLLPAGRGPCRLLLVSPYVDDTALERLSELDHRYYTLRMIVRTAEAEKVARRVARAFPWHDAQSRRLPDLHAKIFVALRDGSSGHFLVGSHNLTRAGGCRNLEAGVLYRTDRVQSCNDPLLVAADHFCELWDNPGSVPSNPEL